MGYCIWDVATEQMIRYHDEEWGVPLHEDRGQFEFLSMEVMQCGISFGLVMRKREILRRCFADFDYDKVAAFGPADVERIMGTEGMIRNRRKIEAVISNAAAFRKIREEFGSFSAYLWGFSGNRAILYEGHADGWIPAANGLSKRVSADLKGRGFKFTGPVVVYSHLQACGIINDHDKSCSCYKKLTALYPVLSLPPDDEQDVRFYN